MAFFLRKSVEDSRVNMGIAEACPLGTGLPARLKRPQRGEGRSSVSRGKPRTGRMTNRAAAKALS